MTEKLLLQACDNLQTDIISLDLSTRLGFHLKHKMVGLALSRGICFEVCYGAGVTDANARRNLIGNFAGLVRATRTGKGIVVSSEARKAVGLRAPMDVVNLLVLWGMKVEVARDAVGALAGGVVRQAEVRRKSFKGVVEVVDDGGVEEEVREKKRKAEVEAERAKGEVKQSKGNGEEVPQQKLTKAQRKERQRDEAAKKSAD